MTQSHAVRTGSFAFRLAAGLLLAAPLCLFGALGCNNSEHTPDTADPSPARLTAVSDQTGGHVHTLAGQDALGDWTTDAPGMRRKLTLAELPAPYATRSIDNGPHMIGRPEGAWPKAPVGFAVTEYTGGMQNPRQMTTAPNGDVFIVESDPGRVKVLRDSKGTGKPDIIQVFAAGLVKPFGVTFYPPGPNPQYLYIGNTDSVVRFPYHNGDLQASGPQEMIVDNLPGGGRLRGGGHWTRDVKFSKDGKRMFVSVGSLTNVHERPIDEARRADILEFTPAGKNERIFASGIRNAVSLAIHPTTGEVWASVNERDGLGDHLVPDYVTHVQDGGFYGWPWFYMGGHPDERAVDPKPELKTKVITPDVLLQSHSASLGMIFYTGAQFPKEYRLDGFAAEHGSWNRARRTGYKVIRIPLQNGKATGEYEDFLTGFVTADGDVWGRPVGVTQAKDGALLVSDDGSGTIWRVAYTGAAK